MLLPCVCTSLAECISLAECRCFAADDLLPTDVRTSMPADIRISVLTDIRISMLIDTMYAHRYKVDPEARCPRGRQCGALGGLSMTLFLSRLLTPTIPVIPAISIALK